MKSLRSKINFYYKLVHGSDNLFFCFLSRLFRYKLPFMRKICINRITAINHKIAQTGQ